MSSASLPQHTELKDDVSLDALLRPASLGEYVGQPAVKRNLETIMRAAKKRGEMIDHILLHGQAGLGKTTLASLIAGEMGCRLRMTAGPAIEKAGDLAALLSGLEEGDILFIDEIHRMNRSIEEMLYPAMESRVLHLVAGKGPAARMIAIDLPPFTLVGATTRVSMLSSPLRSRFGATFKIDYYTQEDIEQIIGRSAGLLGLPLDAEGTRVIAAASRFTPRTANRLLRRVRDVFELSQAAVVDRELALRALEMFEIDHLGLEEQDRRLLRTTIEKFNGGPVGLSSLAAALNEDKGTIEDVYEPYLIKMGFLQRTSQGRVVLDSAYEHLGIEKKS